MFVFLIFISLPCNLVMRNKDYIINKLSRQKGQQEEHNGYTKQKNKTPTTRALIQLTERD